MSSRVTEQACMVTGGVRGGLGGQWMWGSHQGWCKGKVWPNLNIIPACRTSAANKLLHHVTIMITVTTNATSKDGGSGDRKKMERG
jgi:hypothetical protein